MSVPDSQQFPEQRPTEPIVRAQTVPPGWRGSPRGFLWVVLVALVLMLLVPYFAQQVSFAIARGKALARAEVARKELANLPPDSPVRYPEVAKIIEPSVVGVRTTLQASQPAAGNWWFEPRVVAMAQGSGVIVDKAGYILTNAHVINGYSPGGVTVQLDDGRTVQHATIVGIDPVTDLAVLKINAGGLTAAEWGDSDALEVGDSVLAVGSPYGLTETVTAGIISAKNRNVGIENVRYQDFLQTDAAVNPGNSGGPLVNMNARVIGINTAIVGHANQGIGFAIPSGLAKKVYELLRTTGISRGWIGVAVQDLDAAVAEKLGLPNTHGTVIVEVGADSPAERADLKPGDVIVSWQGEAIGNSNDLRLAVAQTKPGTKVTIGYYRDGKKHEASITVAGRPSQTAQ